MTRFPRFLSRLSIRLLAFNVLLVFLPASGVLVLDTYERHMLEAQERTMSQEARLLAAALEAMGELTPARAESILVRLGQRHLARLRVVDGRGNLLADSARLGPRREAAAEAPVPGGDPMDRSLLYRVASLPFRALRDLTDVERPPGLDPYEGADWLLGPEIQDALEGRYGARTRVTPGDRRSLTLYVAIPVRSDQAPAGAVLASQSTSRILAALYEVRLDVFKVFLASVGAAVVLTLLVSTTIARPLARLRRTAEAIVDRRGRLLGGFQPSDRRDEIGDLERALAGLSRRLEVHLQQTESFAGDLSHEFKNPLASIRTATEMALEVDDPAQRRRFLAMIERDVGRLERLLSGVREISHIDARLGEEEREPVAVDELVEGLVEAFRLRLGEDGPRIVLAVADHGLTVDAAPDRLAQVVENLLDNAVSFSPPEQTVNVTVRGDADQATVSVADRGPGIPAEHHDLIFSRFFSYRPTDADDDHHSGLGLAIVRAIVEGYSGQVEAGDRDGGGTVFTVTLPRSS